MAADDPAVLDDLLALPRVHLVVDGYNVTKLGYGNLSLQDQRERLVNSLASLAARTGAEVTCCFDGAAVDVPVVIAKPRNVRVLFSLPGEIADELIRRLVANEPEGRPVVVVSSDKEVAEGVRRSGARPVASAALLKRLERG
nr:NYN domain-containing protein [Motilibacter aurantiacus]